jgi:hypothetical protein
MNMKPKSVEVEDEATSPEANGRTRSTRMAVEPVEISSSHVWLRQHDEFIQTHEYSPLDD